VNERPVNEQSGHGPARSAFERWVKALEARHLSSLTFQEVRKGLQALSSLYVERRSRIAGGGAMDGAGKRAAFALFYGPLHFLLVEEIVRRLGVACPGRTSPHPVKILDIGCGTAAAGSAWALQCGHRPAVTGVEQSWSKNPAQHPPRRTDAARSTHAAGRGLGIVAAFPRSVPPACEDLTVAVRGGSSALIVEHRAALPALVARVVGGIRPARGP
jgi:hypothetical protein